MNLRIERPRYQNFKVMYSVSIYGCVLFSLSLSISILSTEFDLSVQVVLETFMTIAYVVCVIGCLVFIGYLYHNRYNKYEDICAQLTGSSSSLTSKMSQNLNKPSNIEKVVYSLTGENVSAYLKLGISVFGGCSITYSVIMSNIFQYNLPECRNFREFIYYFFQIMFYLVQIVFILKYHNLIMLKFKKYSKAMLVQIIYVDIMSWTMIAISKLYSMYGIMENKNCTTKELFQISIYLVPFVAEYMIVCIAVFYEILLRVGEISAVTLTQHHGSTTVTNYARNKFGFSISIFSILCVIEIFFVMILYSISIGKQNLVKLYMLQELILNLLGLLLNIFVFQTLSKLQFTFPYYTNGVDANLLVASGFFSMFFCIQIVAKTFHTMVLTKKNELDLGPEELLIISLRASNALIELVEIIIQTFVLMDGFHRCVMTPNQIDSKPGQNLISALVGVNTALWILKSLQMKKGDIFFNGSELANLLPDNNQLTIFFLYLSAPLTLLYRYHSSVCFANIFKRIYEDESERFELILRAEGFGESLKESWISAYENKPRTTVANLVNARMRILSAKNQFRKLGSLVEQEELTN